MGGYIFYTYARNKDNTNTKGEKEMKTYLINEEQRQEVLKYMWTRPYGEVHRLMEIILKLQEKQK